MATFAAGTKQWSQCLEPVEAGAIPGWIDELGFRDEYKYWLSMSVVAVPICGLTFSTDALARLITAGTYKHGQVLCRLYRNGISYLPGFDIRKNKQSDVRHRGRKPHKSDQPKRKFGKESSFGTSISLYVNVKYAAGNIVPIGGMSISEAAGRPAMSEQAIVESKYKIKIFATSIQVSGCKMESLEDVHQIALLVAELITNAYDAIPPRPESFAIVRDYLDDMVEAPLICPKRSDLDNVRFREPRIYSRNFNFHPQRLYNVESVEYSLDLSELYHYLNTSSEINDLKESCGLMQIMPSYYPPSDNTNQRLLILFVTPKADRQLRLTTSVIYSSGKIGVNLGNNYYWSDVLWRIFGFIAQIIKPAFIKEKIHISRAKNKHPPIELETLDLEAFWNSDDEQSGADLYGGDDIPDLQPYYESV